MEKRTMGLLFLGTLTLGLCLALSPSLVNYAQDLNEQERDARQAVSKNAAGKLFLDKVTEQESGWKLKKGNYHMKMAKTAPTAVDASFEKGNRKISISLYEFDTTEEAASAFHSPGSHGSSVKLDKYGDEGEKVYMQTGAFALLLFRHGTVVVSISGPDEKIADRFAKHAFDAVKGSGIK
jgi:hypothetical protein